jgi:hypothetical protein
MSQSIVRLLNAMEPILVNVLDMPQDASKTGETITVETIAKVIYKYSIGLLQDIAKNSKREVKDFRTTLVLAAAGKENLFWYKVGDSEIVVEKDGKLSCIGKSIKGEYANQTVFVDANLKIQDVQYGLIDCNSVTGIALMSDGTAEKLISMDYTRIAERLSKFFDSLRNSKMPREELYKFLTDYETWIRTNHDDKTLLLASRKEIK